jgi:hypothetical protein
MITINITKAKAIGHDMRRAARAEEFKQIPGVDAQAAEAARQAIRDKYAALQAQMDAATTADELKNLLPQV